MCVQYRGGDVQFILTKMGDVQYNRDIMINVGDILSTVDVGDILSTVGDVQYHGRYHDPCGGYHDPCGGYHDPYEGIS